MFIAHLVEIFREVGRVLKDDGTLWLNLGDSYNNYAGNRGAAAGFNKNAHECMPKIPGGRGLTVKGLKNKDLIGIPWMLAFALRADGYYLRQDIIWHKPTPMPESVTDRCTKSHEYIFLLSKSERYYYDSEAMKEPATQAGKRVSLGDKSFSKGQAAGAGIAPSGNGRADFYDVPETRNRRSVWSVATKPYEGAHFATYPEELIEPCIMAGSRVGDIVLDPFMGSGTTAQVAQDLGRQYIGCELNPAYKALQDKRTKQQALLLA
jgi:DNA modification methylase